MVVTSKEWVIVMELITGMELQIYVDNYVEEHKKSISEVCYCCGGVVVVVVVVVVVMVVVVMVVGGKLKEM